MTCCSENSAVLANRKPRPTQHVNYAKGMVLGVDDFTQEFAYLVGRSEWLARDLVGYGTASGLAVTAEDDGVNGPRIRVTDGSAVTPRGTLVCVPEDQCASLNAWLRKPENLRKLRERVGLPPALTLYLTLCYDECQTAQVPIPGEPCRDESELMAYSRVADDFGLSFELEAPAQLEDDALRDFVRWLRSIPVDETAPALDARSLDAALRDAVKPWTDAAKAATVSSPPAAVSSPPITTLSDFFYGSPPAALRISPAGQCELLRAAFRLWVTELRPLWMARCCGCRDMEASAHDCILLAKLDLPLVPDPQNPGSGVTVGGNMEAISIDVTERPFLVHQRLLQEWLLCGSCCTPGSPLTSPPSGGVSAAQKRIVGTPLQVIVSETASAITLAAPQDLAAESRPTFDGLTTTGRVHIAFRQFSPAPGRVGGAQPNLDLDETMHCVACAVAGPLPRAGPSATVTLPACGPDNQGRLYTVKNVSGRIEVRTSGGNQIEGNATLDVAQGKAVTVISDGKSNWLAIATF